MGRLIIDRFTFLCQTARPGWKWLVLLPIGFLGTFTLIRDEILPASWREPLQTSAMLGWLPVWPWEWWVIFGLLVAIAFIIEGAYRLVRVETAVKIASTSLSRGIVGEEAEHAYMLISAHEVAISNPSSVRPVNLLFRCESWNVDKKEAMFCMRWNSNANTGLLKQLKNHLGPQEEFLFRDEIQSPCVIPPLGTIVGAIYFVMFTFTQQQQKALLSDKQRYRIVAVDPIASKEYVVAES